MATTTVPQELLTRLAAQQERVYDAQGICQVVRRRMEMLEGDDLEIAPIRHSLAVVEKMLEEAADGLDTATLELQANDAEVAS